MLAAKYIAVEGVIGVGKTTLTKKLAEHYQGETIFEPVTENPFLANFYEDRAKYAFQTQLYFCLNRYRQQVEARQPGLFQRVQVCDYLFAKDRLFAHLNLEGAELELYDQVYSLLDPKMIRPDLVIYLQAPIDTICRRIERRGLEFERKIERKYLEDLGQLYLDFFATYTEAPVLFVQTAELNLVERPEDLDYILRAIETPWQGHKQI